MPHRHTTAVPLGLLHASRLLLWAGHLVYYSALYVGRFPPHTIDRCSCDGWHKVSTCRPRIPIHVLPPLFGWTGKLHLRETLVKIVHCAVVHPPSLIDPAVPDCQENLSIQYYSCVQHEPPGRNPRLSKRVVPVLGERAVCLTTNPAVLRRHDRMVAPDQHRAKMAACDAV